MVQGSQVALKHVIHDMEVRTLVVELRRQAIERWVPCGDMDRRLKIPHSVTSLSVHWVLYTECTDRDSHFHTSIPSVQIGTRKVGGVLSN